MSCTRVCWQGEWLVDLLPHYYDLVSNLNSN